METTCCSATGKAENLAVLSEHLGSHSEQIYQEIQL